MALERLEQKVLTQKAQASKQKKEELTYEEQMYLDGAKYGVSCRTAIGQGFSIVVAKRKLKQKGQTRPTINFKLNKK